MARFSFLLQITVVSWSEISILLWLLGSVFNEIVIPQESQIVPAFILEIDRVNLEEISLDYFPPSRTLMSDVNTMRQTSFLDVDAIRKEMVASDMKKSFKHMSFISRNMNDFESV